MSYISVIVIYLDNGAENACISSDFGFFLECTLVHVRCLMLNIPCPKNKRRPSVIFYGR
jgi:hypothetical protein